MKTMKTLTIGGNTYEIYDEKARSDIETLKNSGTGGVSSWNDLTDRPFYEENNQTVIEWDGNTEGRDSFTIDAPMYKVSDLTPSYEELVGCSVIFAYNNEGVVDGESTEYGADDIDTTIDGVLQIGNGHVCVCNLTEQQRGEYGVPSNGIYFYRAEQSEGVYAYTSSLTYGSTTYHPLDEVFIPDTIARSADIPTDDHINELIDAKLADFALPSAEEVAF